jgi:hypothetical protein
MGDSPVFKCLPLLSYSSRSRRSLGWHLCSGDHYDALESEAVSGTGHVQLQNSGASPTCAEVLLHVHLPAYTILCTMSHQSTNPVLFSKHQLLLRIADFLAKTQTQDTELRVARPPYRRTRKLCCNNDVLVCTSYGFSWFFLSRKHK